MEAVTDERADAVPAGEAERRYRLIREAMEADGLDAVLAAGTLHFGELSIGEIKAWLDAAGVEVRR